MIPILLSMNPSKPVRNLLYVCLPICLIGLLATQTRGLWLSAIISFALYICIRLFKSRTLRLAHLLKSGLAILLLVAIAEVILRISAGVGFLHFVQTRLMAHESNELINPYSSLGYRIHESLVVWEKRTWFGHGSGARLYIFFTQMGMSKFINWWSIHSEYFEILHKYGFLGLGIFMTFILGLLLRAYRIAVHGKAFTSGLGFLVFTTLTNHCLVSITSGYLVRENVMLYMVLLVGIVERYYPRVFPASAPVALNPEADPAMGLNLG
jgi:O-antigen ligase